ncbi:MAG: deoxyribodipyrimidine photo-lyase [Peptococcaceae bacterium]|nr:deoxyribodipyrimidine photo-lyase [Peptococcaceae bacterium]
MEPIELKKRALELNVGEIFLGPVVYWMSRDQRAVDNWALLYAQNRALEMKQPLIVVFNKANSFLGAGREHYLFMMTGLAQVYDRLEELNIPFIILEGDPENSIVDFVKNIRGGLLVTDFNPLIISRKWKKSVAENIGISFVEIDAHNIVPYHQVSEKQEYAAYTIRHKLHKRLGEYLREFPQMVRHPFSLEPDSSDYLQILNQNTAYQLGRDRLVQQGYFKAESGEKVAMKTLEEFIENRLSEYHRRNDPNAGVSSGLSPYLHFGQISAQRVALEIPGENINSPGFLEELIVRRELADNFCYYNTDYGKVEGFPGWARESHARHRQDIRSVLYRLEDLENCRTQDNLWNAAQMEMAKTGYMQGYLRMYWAKKILEWTYSPEEAISNAIYLNDKYMLDGRDPNGYAGIAWSIGGVHDRAWGEREIFGKIRTMTYQGCKRKFNIQEYVNRIGLL